MLVCDNCLHSFVCKYMDTMTPQDKCKCYKNRNDVIIIPDNATNGDMIKAIFPGTTGTGFDAQLNFEMHLNNEHNYHVGKFNQDWWNEPYVYKENKE